MFRGAKPAARTRVRAMFDTDQTLGGCSGSRGAAMARKVDRRVQRTRKLLQDALLSLIRERGFEALSVQEIIDRADVGRATFYAHFDNKEDLLLSGLEGLRATLKVLQRQAQTGGAAEERFFGFSQELFTHTDQHRDVFRAMAGERSVGLIQQVFHRMLVELVRDELKATVPREAPAATSAEPVVQFVAGGLFGMLMWWLEGRSRPKADEVNALFRRLAVPAMAAGSHGA